MITSCLRLILLCMVLPLAVRAQTYNFRHFNEDNGLKDIYIYGLSQSPDGVLYMATGKGVTAFDGNEFYPVFDAESQNRFVITLFIDSRNILWMGLQQNGIVYRKDGRTVFVRDSALVNTKITSITEDGKGNIYFSTAGAGLWRVDSLFRLSAIPNAPAMITSLCVDPPSGLLLAGTDEGLWLYDVVSAKSEMSPLFEDRPVRQVVRSGSESFFVLAEDGVHRLRVRGKEVRRVYGPAEDPKLAQENATAIGADRDGVLWIFDPSAGLMRLRENTAFPGSALILRTIGERQGFAAKQVQHIFEDKEGSIWFGTYGEGLIQKPPQRFTFFGEDELGPLNDIASLLMVHDSDLWFGGNEGLAHFNIRNAKYQQVQTGKDLRVTCLARDGKGVLWIGTEQQGIFAFNPITKILVELNKTLGETVETVNHLYVRQGRIYCGTASGLIIFDESMKVVEWLRTNDGLLHNNVRQVMRDSKGRLWIASHGAPPYYIRNRKVFPFRKIQGLRTFNINAYCEDRSGKIWIATEGDGVFSYDLAFTQYTTKDGLASDFCNGLAVGSDHSLWVTHRAGLSQKQKSSQRFRQFTKVNGLKYTDFCRNSAFSSRRGRMFFAARNALVQFDGDIGKPREVVPETQITGVKLDKETFAPQPRIQKDYGFYSVRIDFKSVSLADPGGLRYKYRLLGADTAWYYTDRRFAEFQQLSDGRFIFEVSAINEYNGARDETPARVTILIKPPVWRSPWFYLFLLALVIFTTYAIVNYRTRALKRRQLLLELKVKQKTFLLQREKDAVEAIKLVVEQKNKDITDSINYAKKIQDSILPPDELLQELFGDGYFVLFRPKDIVSGDIYWASALNATEGKKMPLALAAVVDCTGHGVPGAFLSIMANDFLRQSINDRNVNKPHEILNFLNGKISSHLNQTAKSQIRDGMDIAIIGIDHKTKTLYFSGANNPIYIFRESGGEVDTIILTATKQAIGLVSEETVPFAGREFKLKAGDRVCLFSDGYADQFGGEHNKKLGYKRFREIIASSFHLPMQDQKEYLRQCFDDWKKDEPQTDDMCVMCILIW
jgi:ligand-binding sensor domain-containing protein/serine phosphatase RsbU (regulator of sigma subunit)